MYNYENRIVIFFDILGFRNWVNEEVKKSGDDCSSIIGIFAYIQKFYEEEFASNHVKDKQISFFSDSVIISFKVDNEYQFFKTIADLQILIFNLVRQKVLIRGAVTYGKAFHTDDYILGPAFMSAYDLETKKSIVPRVICDIEVIAEAMRYKDEVAYQADVPYLLQLFEQDADKQLYIDYFKKISEVFDDEKQYYQYMVMLRSLIVENLNEIPDLNIRGKYLWMKEKFNETVLEHFQKSIPTDGSVNVEIVELLKKIILIS